MPAHAAAVNGKRRWTAVTLRRQSAERNIVALPLTVDVGLMRRPWANWALIGITAISFLLTTRVGFLERGGDNPLVLHGLGPGIVGHVLLHAHVLHLLGNMAFLWVFGNAVCARVGSLGYLACYAGFAVIAAFAHLVVSGGRAVGASGAINGVVGMFLVFHPKDYFTFGIVELGRIRSLPAWILVAFWALLDAVGLLSGETGTAYAAHLGGLAGGVVLAIILLKTEAVDDGPGATLLDLYWRR